MCDSHPKQWLTWPTPKYLCVEPDKTRWNFALVVDSFKTTNLNQIVNVSKVLSPVVSWTGGNALISCSPTCRVTTLVQGHTFTVWTTKRQVYMCHVNIYYCVLHVSSGWSLLIHWPKWQRNSHFNYSAIFGLFGFVNYQIPFWEIIKII